MNVRALICVEVAAVYAVPTLILFYGITSVVLAVIFGEFRVALALLLLLLLGVAGLYSVCRLTLAVLGDASGISNRARVLTFLVAGVVAWVVVSGVLADRGYSAVLAFFYWAPLAVAVQLVVQNWRRLRKDAT